MRVLWINGLGESRIPRCIFVAIVHDGLIGERGKVGERTMHVFACTLEEAAASADEQGIPGEHAARVRRVSLVSNVVAYGILCVARVC